MAITFYYGSGSPFAWKIWLVLEHKGLTYEAKRVMFDAKELKSEAFLALNPRGRVPVLVDDGLVIYESNAIAEHLEDRHPTPTVLGDTPAARARTRQIAAEADADLYRAQRELMANTLFRPAERRDTEAIERARGALLQELTHWQRLLGEAPYFGGPAPSLADYTAFPLLRAIVRVDDREPGLGLGDRTPAWQRDYLARMEASPAVQKTWPPHWRS
ncbi:MAG: glutathione S-transferase family protein [Nannocystis sp.]|nr:glutathione S-transferase family protein [Nannocystis sp.]